MTVSVRPAVPTDHADLVRLAVEHAASVAGTRGAGILLRHELSPADPAERLAVAEDGTAHGRSVAVGCIGEVVVGYAVLEFRDAPAGRLARITELLTDPGARACGVGEAMLGWCEAEARRAACIGLDAVALPGDRDTKNFFETFGMTARLITVHRPLTD